MRRPDPGGVKCGEEYGAGRAIDALAPACHGRTVRVLGLDVGSRTIGVAVSDELGVCAHAVRTLSRRGTRADVEQVRALVRDLFRGDAVERVVVGLPYDCEGNEGQRARRVRVFGEALAQAGLAVEYQDESFSTVEATDILLEADLSRRRRKQVVDRLAAAVILQAWLDRRRAETGEGA